MGIFKGISQNMAHWIERHSEGKHNAEIVAFGIETFFNQTFTFIVMIAVGIVFNRLWEMFVLTVSFGILRRYTGGAHIQVNYGCSIFSTLLIFCLSFIKVNVFASYLMVFWSAWLIFKNKFFLEAYQSERALENKEQYEKLAYIWILLGLITPYFPSLHLFTIGIFAQSLTITREGIEMIHYINQKFSKGGEKSC